MRRRRNAAFAIALLAISLYVPLGSSQQADAVGAACRTDPIFFFSNDDKLSVSMTIGVLPQDIIKIDYVVHAPTGTSLEQVVSTGPVETSEATSPVTGTFKVFLPMILTGGRAAKPRALETFKVQYDRPTEGYAVEAVALTAYDPDHPVPVTLQLSLRNNKQQISGESGQSLQLEVRP